MEEGTINYLCTYDLYGPVRKVLDLGRQITWGSGGEGLALEIESFVGLVKLHEPIGECNLGPTKLTRA
jgi:hypothetical protein